MSSVIEPPARFVEFVPVPTTSPLTAPCTITPFTSSVPAACIEVPLPVTVPVTRKGSAVLNAAVVNELERIDQPRSLMRMPPTRFSVLALRFDAGIDGADHRPLDRHVG